MRRVGDGGPRGLWSGVWGGWEEVVRGSVDVALVIALLGFLSSLQPAFR